MLTGVWERAHRRRLPWRVVGKGEELMMRRRLVGDEQGQGLVEYALIIALVSLASVVALGFLSGKINDVFFKSGNVLNSVDVVAAPGGTGGTGGTGGPTAPSSGTTVLIAGVGTFTYLNPGPAHTGGTTTDCGGSDAACGGHAGFYSTGNASSPTSFSSATGTWSGGYTSTPAWTFSCTWHTSGTWAGGTYGSGCW
jgi:pilus assembly protein Flp/PilA